MELDPHVDRLRHELAVAAGAADPDVRALADRLTASLDSAARLTLLEALSAAADEITREIAPGSVDIRLRGSEPAFVVTLPPAEDATPPAAPAAAPFPDAEDGPTTRINLRLPDALKSRVEAAAARERLSVNAWLVRAASAAVSADGGGAAAPPSHSSYSDQRLTGWVR